MNERKKYDLRQSLAYNMMNLEAQIREFFELEYLPVGNAMKFLASVL